MLLWMIQTLTVWENLQEAETLYQRPDQLDYPNEYADSYAWLRAQMGNRVADYKGHDPWWAVLEPRPHWMDFPDVGETTVCLKLEVPDSNIALTSNSAWAAVLNRCYIPADNADDEEWTAELEKNAVDEFAWPLPEPWNTRLIKSWQRMFEISDNDLMGEYGPNRDVDAYFEGLRREYVKKCIILERVQ